MSSPAARPSTPLPVSLPRTMTALRAHVRGGPEQLVVEDAPRPRPGDGELLVEVHAAAITFAELDWDLSWTREGRDRTPVIPSHEFSGVVVEHGPGDPGDAPPVGAPVYGLVPFDRDGAAADYVVVPRTKLAPKPQRCTHVEAAALPLAASTAWQALVRQAGTRPGDRVLVHGGAGGVGSFAVQIALALGAHVTTTVLARHLDYVTGLGVQRAVDVDRDRFDADQQQFDVVIDTVGGETLQRSFPVVRRGGRIVTLQAPPDPELSRAHGVEGIFFVVDPDAETLAAVSGMVDSGELRVEIAATYPLTEGAAAYASGARSPRAPGKTVLRVRST